ncbi:sulfite exporter TauE/SafE family protein [Carboxylicivirga sp. A043]|uniref:sulfite exporter TauE/SafE family protein n=1 Tax=Carboxylicivirga litoralis TaxID=2816963 RepID=UPI0021CB1F6A|nr:sulfite exporter TauE/SafE family protein [Carboxylicivirga sp. A043]MCU4155468.1 sulfite exporter TauE/SafE family protein [Carboxylicivirga sp. A043]
MDISILNVALLILAGLFAGFINTLAGSGSLITLPLLMFLGLSPHQANATNRIAIFFQNVVAVRNFKQQGLIHYKSSLFLVVPALIGSIIGASIAISINEDILNLFIGSLLFVMFFIILLKPDKWVKAQAGQANEKPAVWQIVIFFFIGVYGGFIQAGVGFFLLAGLVLGVGYDLIEANAIKVFIVLTYTAVALVIFIWSGQVNFIYGIILAIGNASGAFIASKYAQQIGVKYIRYILLTTVFVAAVKVLLL